MQGRQVMESQSAPIYSPILRTDGVCPGKDLLRVIYHESASEVRFLRRTSFLTIRGRRPLA